MTVAQRFFAKIQFPDNLNECWVWTACTTPKGYGSFRNKGTVMGAHRYSYLLHYGELDESLSIDHLCRNRICVNPLHLEQVTAVENTMRGNGPTAVNARLTHCKHGHEFSDSNTYIRPEGGRKCKACHKVTAREWARKNARNHGH